MSAQVLAHALANVARPLILTRFRKDSCIASTRIGIDALAYFGVKAVPVSLQMLLFNREAVELLNSGKTLEEIAAFVRERGLNEEGGPWTMGVGADLGRPGGWAGHLVVGVPAANLLVDLSIDQVSRPHKGLVLDEPAVLQVPETWWTGETDMVQFTNPNDGSMIFLDQRESMLPDRDGYRKTSNWKGRAGGSEAPVRAVTGQVIRAMKDEVLRMHEETRP